MGSNCNGVPLGLNKYPMARNLPRQLGCMSPDKKGPRGQSQRKQSLNLKSAEKVDLKSVVNSEIQINNIINNIILYISVR